MDQMPAELIKAGCRTIRRKTHKLNIFIWSTWSYHEIGMQDEVTV